MLMVTFTKENGNMINGVEKVFIFTQTGTDMKDYFKIINSMV